MCRTPLPWPRGARGSTSART
ncbi:MAG: hypothetical protein FJY92_04870 [Candidatus Hydrogenedentes bacterium]|nr:hypothetical protein [Candidatus Hydrogenedentota bacterium]